MKAPTPIFIRLSRTILRLLRDTAARRHQYRRYAARADAWGRGFIKDAILVGLVGEHGLCDLLTRRHFPCCVDLKLYPNGDGGRDILVSGVRIQVKTRRRGLAKRSFVRRFDRGKIIPLQCDAYVFAQWEESQDTVQILGWVWATDASRRATVGRSPLATATHWNLKIDDASLLPMSRLVDDLFARRESTA
jgi:hypothetical protein